MATNKQGEGTKNLPINMPIAEKKLLGRLGAMAEPPSTAANFVRWCVLKYLEDHNPNAASELRHIRAEHQKNIDARRMAAIQKRFPNSDAKLLEKISEGVAVMGAIASEVSPPSHPGKKSPSREKPQKRHSGKKGSTASKQS